MLMKTVLISTFFLCFQCEPLRNTATDEQGNGSKLVPQVEQIDIDKELQKELNTLESRLAFVESTFQNFLNGYNDLKQNYGNLKTQYSQAMARIHQLENVTQQTRQEISAQNSQYSTLESINSNLQKTVDNTNVRLSNSTSVLWTEISNVTDEVINISDMTNRSFDFLKNKNVILENKFQEISKNQSSIVSALNHITSPGSRNSNLVVFVAQLSREILISTHEIIIFDKSQLNEGHGFDSTTGVFTATTQGIYTFSASVESDNRDVRGAIYRNNEPFVYILGLFVDQKGAFASAMSYVHLDEGDRVWVQWTGGVNGRIGHFRSQFTGHLLREDFTIS
uniref:Uncharacterized protein LOC111120397 n=1 Tax=Crassostrea virginica TaxID=6565 RepID=A0A8B8CLV8_CRAVI|nr:uncharacterized protein LOC111120397 [Crassostrea virginica]